MGSSRIQTRLAANAVYGARWSPTALEFCEGLELTKDWDETPRADQPPPKGPPMPPPQMPPPMTPVLEEPVPMQTEPSTPRSSPPSPPPEEEGDDATLARLL